jgi:hypothetical protein
MGPDALLAAETGATRPGLELVAIDDAALPMAWLDVEVLAQERKRLALLDEFVLRLVAEGIDTVEVIASVLGIGDELVSATVADQLVLDRLALVGARDGSSLLRLTAVGQDVAHELAAVSPREEIIGYSFDMLMGRVTAYPRSMLVSAQQVTAMGARRLPKNFATVTESDVTPSALNQLLAERSSDDSLVEILACRRVRHRASLFLPVKLLVFADGDGREVQLALVIAGQISRAHELQLSQAGGADKLKLKAGPPAESRALDADLMRQLVPRNEVHNLWLAASGRESDSREAGMPEGTPQQTAQTLLATYPVRAVDTFEFADLINQAFLEARSRVLVLSSRLELVATDSTTVDAIERCVRSGVDVRLAYRQAELGSTRSTTRRLLEIADRFPAKLSLVELQWNPPETLVWDNNWVAGTYPWLSARSELDRPRRREAGTLVRLKEHVDRVYDDYMLKTGRAARPLS